MHPSFLFTVLAWAVSFQFTCYAGYYYAVAVFGLRKPKSFPDAQPSHRFGVVVAARNEEEVIGHLVESLAAQDYPRELFDIIVAPNNCTDNTAQAAQEAGARLFHCTLPVRSKGEVLTQVFDQLLTQDYDAFCVFDADNLVDPGFLRAMNNALAQGVNLAQGYRDSKNPHDSPISGCYSIYYWMINRFYSQARARLGLSAIINGSGFMVRASLLRRMGGWHTRTMTEDIEFTAQSVLEGEAAAWVPQAVTYDEQPLTFAQSWKQRKRWATGLIQGTSLYLRPLARRAISRRDRVALDQAIFLLAPFMAVLLACSILIAAVNWIAAGPFSLFPQTHIFLHLFLSFSTSSLSALAVVLLEKKAHRKIWKGVCFYWIYLLSWIPINLLCLVKKTTTWDAIRHTRGFSFSQLGGRS